MKDITVKSPYDNVTVPAPAGEVLDNTEYNDRRVELQGAVTDSSQALSAADAGQLSKAMFANGVAAQSMIDSGGVNTIILTPITGANGLRLATPVAPDYTLLDGAIFSFQANNTNTGNMTVNIGQTNPAGLIGALKLFLADGTTEVPAAAVFAGRYYDIRYDPSLDAAAGGFVVLTPITDYLTMYNSGSITIPTTAGKLVLGAAQKQSNIAIASDAITLKANKKYVLSYTAIFDAWNGVSPQATIYFNEISGDASWNLPLMTKSGAEVDQSSEVATLSSTTIIIPSSDTVIELWAIQTVGDLGRLFDLSVSVWSE